MSCYLEEAVHERLGSWGTAGNVNVNGDDSEKRSSSRFSTTGVHSSPVTSPDDSIGVVVIASAISAAAHTHLNEHIN